MLVDLALNSNGSPVRLVDISKRQGISLKYLEKLISELKSAGFVKSVRGSQGGYLLNKLMEDISVGDIVRALETPNVTADCTESDTGCGVCNRAGECLTQYIWQEAVRTMFEKLDSFKIDRLINRSDEIVKGVLSVSLDMSR